MIQIFLMTFVVLAVVMAIMAIGLLFDRKPIKGSCGGLNNIPGVKSDCSCSSPCEKKRQQG